MNLVHTYMSLTPLWAYTVNALYWIAIFGFSLNIYNLKKAYDQAKDESSPKSFWRRVSDLYWDPFEYVGVRSMSFLMLGSLIYGFTGMAGFILAMFGIYLLVITYAMLILAYWWVWPNSCLKNFLTGWMK